MSFTKEKEELIYWGGVLNQKGLVSARSGNISYKAEGAKVLITRHDSYLGYLGQEDILLINLKDNTVEGEGSLTSEQDLHLGIYKRFADTKAVLHAHPPYTTAFFNYFERLETFSFETKFYLGHAAVIPQETPTVTNIEPVLKALENINIVVLKYHGVVAIGEDFKGAFSLIELLEEQAKVNFFVKAVLTRDEGRGMRDDPENIGAGGRETRGEGRETRDEGRRMRDEGRRYKMLSQEHARSLTELVNIDSEAQELGKKYDLTCTLAVKNQDSGEAMCFYYDKGKIVKTDNNENAEFVIIGREEILKKVFNREIDPFVAVTQGKVKTKGDFAKMSRWYPVMVRTFKLWEQAPVE